MVRRLESVVHHYKPTLFPHLEDPQCFGCSGDCNVNFACSLGDNWVDQGHGVVRLLSSGGGSLCSGSMINNVEQDGRQLFLSADHCGGGAAPCKRLPRAGVQRKINTNMTDSNAAETTPTRASRGDDTTSCAARRMAATVDRF